VLTGQLGLDRADVEDAISIIRSEVAELWAHGPSAIELETAWSRTRLDGFTSQFSSDATASRVLMLSEWNEAGTLTEHPGDELLSSRLTHVLANVAPPRMRFMALGKH
jgi:hypothetical protein